MDKKKENLNEYRRNPLGFRYYVATTVEHRKKGEQIYQYFLDSDSALDVYAALPNHRGKQLGMESLEEMPSKIILLNCFNGWDVIGNIPEGLPDKIGMAASEALKSIQFYLDNHDTEIAYQMEDGYFTIQTTDEGYDYTFYDQDLREVDGGVYDDPDIPVRDAMADILLDADKRVEDCQVIDCEEFLEAAEEISQGEFAEAQEKMFAKTSLDSMEKEEEYAEQLEQYFRRELGLDEPVENVTTKSEKCIDIFTQPTTGKRPSVLETLRLHQSKLKEKKQEKAERVRSTHKKGLSR